MDSVTLSYCLSEMPTAHHKAGLAGLVLSIQEMQNPDRHEGNKSLHADDVPQMNGLDADTVQITLTERSCQALFNECYKSVMGTVKVTKRWKDAEVLDTFQRKQTDEKSGKEKDVTVYVHPNLEPRNPFLDRHLFQEIRDSEKDLWYKLWRDMLFQIPRAKPTTRNPYKEALGGDCNEGAKMWTELQRFAKARDKNEIRTVNLSSSLLTGAQDTTAEYVGFKDRVDNVLALHFWPLTTLIFVPTHLKIDPADFSRSRTEPIGFSLAIPDVADLVKFCSRYTGVLQQVKAKAKPRGYRPDNACVDVAAEGALSVLTQQAWLASGQTQDSQVASRLHAVEYVHLEKQGNNVKTLGSGRVAPDPRLMDRYRAVSQRYRSPLFRSYRVRALLAHERQPWWQSFDVPLQTFPHQLFLRGENLPPLAWSFRRDVSTAFREDDDNESIQTPEGDAMSTTDTTNPPKPIEASVLNIVRTYVLAKSKEKSKVDDATIDAIFKSQASGGDEVSDLPEVSQKDQEFQEKRRNFEGERKKIAEKLFLEVRSRHGDEFQSYFAEHFGAKSQRFNLSREPDFKNVCDHLINRPADVRVMTLLALSACS